MKPSVSPLAFRLKNKNGVVSIRQLLDSTGHILPPNYAFYLVSYFKVPLSSQTSIKKLAISVLFSLHILNDNKV